MTEPSLTVHDFGSIHARPSGGHAGLVTLRRAPALVVPMAGVAIGSGPQWLAPAPVGKPPNGADGKSLRTKPGRQSP